MTVSFASALNAARDAAGAQHYPKGALYVVATPIGNLADVSLRALHVLDLVDSIACEDTRHTQSLLRALSLERPSGGWISVHQHNEAQAAQQVLQRLSAGERVAYVSDAGTPAVSDPGARLAAAVQAAGLRVVPVPGASSVTAVLSVAGALAPAASVSEAAATTPAEAPGAVGTLTPFEAAGFVFAGFLPTKAGDRAAQVQAIAREPRAVVLLEAPHRIAELARSLAVLGPRPVTVGRELTKQFEQVHTGPSQALTDWLAADGQRLRGEFALVLHPWPAARQADDGLALLTLLLEELPVKSAVRIAAQASGASRNALYDAALRLKPPAGRRPPPSE